MDLLEKNKLFLKSFLLQKQLTGTLQRVSPEENSNSPVGITGDQSIKGWSQVSSKALVLPQLFLSQAGYDALKQKIKAFSPDHGIRQYINPSEDLDPHLVWGLLKLREIEQKIGADPDNQSTSTNSIRPRTIIALGSGNGRLLNEMVNTFKPFHLCIAIRSWADLETSFSEIDWQLLWNSRCEHPNQRISILPYSDIDQLRLIIMNSDIIGCEHALIVVPDSSSSLLPAYLDDREKLCGRKLDYLFNYLGFTLDEYNMLWSASATLRRSPRIFHLPFNKIGGKYIVCGSGPSLDANINYVKCLSSSYSVIACASNYRTLRAAGIKVDILCLLERNSIEYEQYLSVKDEFGTDETFLFASVTCDFRLHSLFSDSMVYFRPALTPLAIFSTNPRQVLYLEGPQTVNTGVALCASLRAEEVVLVGVDLGTTSLRYVRSKNAVGTSKRQFDIKTEGNLQDVVYSDSFLMDGKISMERCLSISKLKVFNASDGVKIEGAEPIVLSSLMSKINNHITDKYAWRDWWLKQPRFQPEALGNLWKSSRSRVHVCDLFSSLRELLMLNTSWSYDLQSKIVELMKLDVPSRQQVARRLVRALFLKLSVTITRQNYVLLTQDPSGALALKFYHKVQLYLLEICNQVESEIYELFDTIESDLLIDKSKRIGVPA
ncbi:hypothetical protein OMCYN_00665 [cyanobiont of Ornithocercus magnificus]|nr:hypothetical protein OMCYN_00665 [cyanobiont of Ornithocercus magnificus]